VIALLTAVGAALGALPAPARVEQESVPTRYSATHVLLLNNQQLATSSATPISPSQIPLFATTGDVPKAVVDGLGLGVSGAELASQVQVNFDQVTGALTFTTTQQTADRAVAVADAFADETNSFLERRQDELFNQRLAAAQTRLDKLTTQLDDLTAQLVADPTNQVLIAESDALRNQYSVAFDQVTTLRDNPAILTFSTLASAEAVPIAQTGGLSTPRSRTTRGVLGAVAGAAVGLGIAIVLGRLDRKIRSREQAEAITGLRARVEIPKVKEELARSIVTTGKHDSLSDAYRTLRNVIGFMHTALAPVDRARITLIVSPGPAEGKTSLAANLAAAFAETGQNTVVVNTDFRRPQLGNRLLANPGEALPYFLDDLEWMETEQLLRRTTVPKLSMLDLGRLGSADAMARQTAQLLPRLADDVDAIVIDSSPVTATAEVLEVVPFADLIVVAVKVGRTDIEAAERTVSILRDLSNAPLLLVLTGIKADTSNYYYDYSERRKGSDDSRKTKVERRGQGPQPVVLAPVPRQVNGVNGSSRTPANGAPRPSDRPASAPILSNQALSKLDMDTIDELLRDYTNRPEQR
jgi:Mrp family chromosome partitioning ATPase